MPEQTPQNNSLSEQFLNEQIPLGLPWRLLIFSLTIFAFSVFIYIGLKFGYEPYLDKTATNLDKKIDALTKQVSSEDQNHFISFYSQLVNLQKVLNRHNFSSNIFNFLERNTVSTVFYEEASFTDENKTLILRGQADSNETLVNQLATFQNAPELEKVVLNQMNLADGAVAFQINLIFKEDFLKQLQ